MRVYSDKYPPMVGDYIGIYEDGALKDGFVVRDIILGGTLKVENLTLANGGATPTGVIGFLPPNFTGLKLVSRTAAEGA